MVGEDEVTSILEETERVQSRSSRARALARRVEHEPERHAMRWAALASLWTHMGVLVGLAAFQGLQSASPLEPDVRYHELARLQTPGPPPEIELPENLTVFRVVPDSQGGQRRLPQPPAPEQEDPDKVRFARTERDEAAPERMDAISAHDQQAEVATRAPVLSDQPGFPTPLSQGPSDLSASPTMERRPGDVEAAMGNHTQPPDGAAVRGGGGGAEKPTPRVADGEGIPTDGGGTSPGGALGGGHAGAVAAGPPAARAEVAVTAPEGPDPTLVAARPVPSWWQPTAMRIAPDPRPSVAEGAPAAAALAAPARAPVERTGARRGTGGTEAAVEAPSVPEASTGQGARRRIAAPGTADPVDELRRDLGFGPLDRDKLAPRPAWAGELYQQGASSTSPQVALDVPVDWKTAISTRGTALGMYVQRAEELIAARWNSQDLDAHSRAVGLQGDVTVRYKVTPDGRTTDRVIVRSSGNPILDRMAVASIPARLPRFPKDLERKPLQHEITLHYRNPLVGP
jgi:TonB family protein